MIESSFTRFNESEMRKDSRQSKNNCRDFVRYSYKKQLIRAYVDFKSIN